MVGTVGMSLVTVVSTVIVAVAGPVFWDAAAAVTFELDAGTRMAAACFVAAISTVVVCTSHTHMQDFSIYFLDWILQYSVTDGEGRDDTHRCHSANLY